MPKPQKLYPRLAGFARNRRAAAIIEFALVVPILATLMAGGYEYSRMVQTGRRLTTLADSISLLLAATPPVEAASGNTPATTGKANYITLHYAHDAAMVIFPAVLADSYAKGVTWGSDISISFAGISFAPTVAGCTSSCTYVAHVAWTGDAKKRACGSTQASASNTAAPTANTLPAALFTALVTQTAGVYAAPAPVIVVDVSYTWTPMIFNRFGSVTISRTAYVNARYVNELEYQAITGDDGFGVECSGGY